MEQENLETLTDEELKAEIKREEAKIIGEPTPTERYLRLLNEDTQRMNTREFRVETLEEGCIRQGTGKPLVFDTDTGEFKQWQ